MREISIDPPMTDRSGQTGANDPMAPVVNEASLKWCSCPPTMMAKINGGVLVLALDSLDEPSVKSRRPIY
jgi:hypothetical protein